jgi:D-glycero-alpha-D-manno-heptose-7-phosphate kinase
MIVRSRAPVRIDLAGGWTDVPPFADQEGGAVVNIAINRYTSVTLRLQPGLGVRLHSIDYNATVTAERVEQLEYDGQLDLIKAALKRAGRSTDLELVTRAAAPPGSGLGTSAAMSVALGSASGSRQRRSPSARRVSKSKTSASPAASKISSRRRLAASTTLNSAPRRPAARR